MASKPKPAEINPDDLFVTFAPSARPVPMGGPDDVIIGEFVAVTRGPENEFGRPFIVEFSAHTGTTLTSDGEIVSLVNGEHYSLWLLSTSMLKSFVEARPTVGERFAVKHLGRCFDNSGKQRKGV